MSPDELPRAVADLGRALRASPGEPLSPRAPGGLQRRSGRPDAARTVVITGGSSGIGRCTAALFARQGWRVGLIARGEAGLEAARREALALGAPAASAAVADVADAAALERAADAVERDLGPVLVWVNCAGNGVYGRFPDVTEAEFRRVTEVTYLGVVNGTRSALRRMVPRGRGRVVNVCSAIAYHGLPVLSSYSGAKGAVRGFSEAVQAELAAERSQVRLSVVYPPAVNTPFFSHAASHLALPPRPCRPVYQPEVVADAIHLAATSGRKVVRAGAVTVLFALGRRLAPGLIAWFVGVLGEKGQSTTSPEAARLRDPTLFAPSSRPSGARGPFNRGALQRSPQMWANRHRAALGVAGGLAATAALARWARARR